MSQIKKIKALYHIKWYIITNLHDNKPLSFLFGLFLEAMAETLLKKFRWFFGPNNDSKKSF